MLLSLGGLLFLFPAAPAPDMALASPAAQRGRGPAIERLATLGGDFSIARDMNRHQEVVGYAATEEGAVHAFLWRPGLGMTDLGTLGGPSSQAFAINDRGQIVGASQTESGQTHAFLWEDGVMTDLSEADVAWSAARDLNEDGVIIGAAREGWGAAAPCRWIESEAGRVVEEFPAAVDEVLSVSEDGRIAAIHRGRGRAGEPERQGFLLDDEELVPLEGAEYSSCLPVHINDAGAIVGSAAIPSEAESESAFRWDPRRGLQAMAALGNCQSQALASNERGEIVGWSRDAEGQDRAVLWKKGEVQDLNDSLQAGRRWQLVEAVAVDESGVMAGNGWYKGELTAWVGALSRTALASTKLSQR